MDKNLRSEKLVQYLDGELSGQEELDIEQELAADIAFQQEFEDLKAAKAAIKYHGLQNKVSAIHDQMMKEFKAPVKNSRGRIIKYAIAVAASLVLLVGGYVLYNFATLSSEKVFASRYQPYEMITLRGDDSAASQIEKAYREKEYKKVLTLNQAKNKPSQMDQFLAGSAAMELKNYSKAVETFGKIQGKKFDLDDETDYYLALAYIRNKDFDLALDLLRIIKEDPEHRYNSRVTPKLLRQLRMLKWR